MKNDPVKYKLWLGKKLRELYRKAGYSAGAKGYYRTEVDNHEVLCKLVELSGVTKDELEDEFRRGLKVTHRRT